MIGWLLRKVWAVGWRLGLLAAIGYGLFTFGQGWLLGPRVTVEKVTRTDIVQTVVASGRVQTPSRVEISTQVTGVISKVLAREGDRVAAGDVVVQLDDSEANAAVAQAEASKAQARARLAQIDASALPAAKQAQAQAQANLTNARAVFTRARKLRDQGFSTAAQFDEARRALDVATSQVATARIQADNNEEGGAERMVAAAALEQAAAGLIAAEARSAYALIRAPAAGLVITRSIEPGAVVQPGRALLVLAPEGGTELVLQIDERNLGLLKVGQPAMVSAEAYPSERFAAVLASINPAVDRQRGSIEIKLAVAEPPAYLRQDMTVSVDIEVQRRAGALTLASEAVRDVVRGDPWVYVVTNNKVRKQPVQVGVRGVGRIEILSGVEEGAVVVPTSAGLLTDGQPVRVTRDGAGRRKP